MVQRTWLIWSLICLISVGVQSTTLKFDPPIKQDEVQIVDMGRVSLHPKSDWALMWNVKSEEAVLSVAYLGPVLQEWAFQMTQPDHSGPRILAMIGALCAATCMLGWLLSRGVPSVAALSLAGAFLLDPAFSTTYREGRVDGWAMASGLLACWLIRSAISNHIKKVHRPLVLPFAGAAIVSAPFFWPTAFMLVPLVLLEFAYLLRAKLPVVNPRMYSRVVHGTVAFGVGGAIAAIALLMPVMLNWKSYFEGLQLILAVQTFGATIQSSLFDLIAVYDPIIALATLFALVFRRDYGLLAAFGFALVIMYQTWVYPARIIYLLPYAFVTVAVAATAVWTDQATKFHKAVMIRILVVLLIWNIGLVLVIRPVLALQRESSGNGELLQPALESAIGSGPQRVLLEDWASYYAARNLGWKIYRSDVLLPGPSYVEFLGTMDFIVVQEQHLLNTTKQLVESDARFELKATIQFPTPEDRVIKWGPIEFPVFEGQYPTLLVFKKIPSY